MFYNYRPDGLSEKGMSQISSQAMFIDKFKARAEFFKKGSIIPQRILKGERKKKHVVKFGSDCWAMPTPHGYLVAVDCMNGDSVVRISRMPPKLDLVGSPYGGTTNWFGNHQLTDAEWSDILEKKYKRMFSIT